MNAHQRRVEKRKWRKTQELILFICKKSENDPNFDNEKLEALLFQIDMKSFIETGKPISNFTYYKAA